MRPFSTEEFSHMEFLMGSGWCHGNIHLPLDLLTSKAKLQFLHTRLGSSTCIELLFLIPPVVYSSTLTENKMTLIAEEQVSITFRVYCWLCAWWCQDKYIFFFYCCAHPSIFLSLCFSCVVGFYFQVFTEMTE